MPAGHGGVEGDETKSPEVPDTRHGPLRRLGVEESLTKGGTFVVVARDPHDGGAEALGPGFDSLAQGAVRLGLAEVGQIAREHHRIGPHPVASAASRVRRRCSAVS